jgi:hypothetical protein
MRQILNLRTSAAAVVLAVASLSTSANALVINYDFSDIDSNASLDAATKAAVKLAYGAAGAKWTGTLIDPVTVNLKVGYSSLRPGVLASTGSSGNSISVAAYRTALGLDKTSYVDESATASITSNTVKYFENPHGNGVSTSANGAHTNLRATGVLYNDASNGITADNTNMYVNTSVLKAIGLKPVYENSGTNYNVVDGATFDGQITFNSDFGFYLGLDGNVPPTLYDFTTIAAHEIGHALGFVSGVDTFDFLSGRGSGRNFFGPLSPTASMGDLLGADYDNQGAVITPWDLFKFSDMSFDSKGNFLGNDLTSGLGTQFVYFEDILTFKASGVPTANPYFSIDGGKTNLGALSSGRFNGAPINVPACFSATGGYFNPFGAPCDPGFTAGRGLLGNQQASHYIDSFLEIAALGLPISLLDPTGAPGVAYGPTSLDFITLDAIGWDVPEPANMSLLGLGLLGLGFARRRRQA